MFRSLSLIMIGVLLAPSLASAQEARKGAVVTLPADATSLAVHPKSGAVFAGYASDNKVVVYPELSSRHTLEGARTIDSIRAPGALLVKRLGDKLYLVVLSGADQKLHLFNPDTLEPVKAISLRGPSPRHLDAALNPADPYVYYTSGSGHDCRFSAVNLKTMSEEGVVHRDSVAWMAISGDGEMAYTLGPWSPSGFQSGRLVKGKDSVTFHRVHYDHDSRGDYVRDPASQFVITGSTVWSADLSRKLATLSGTASFVSDHRPVIVGFKGRGRPFDEEDTSRVWLMSANTYKDLASQPFNLPAPKDRFGGRDSWLQVMEDPIWDNLLLWRGASVQVIPYSSFDLPKEPFLNYEIDGPRDGVIARSLELSLKARDKTVAFGIETGPKGLTLKGNKLNWPPGQADVGAHKVVLKAFAGEIAKTRELVLNVRMPSLKLPFRPTQMAVSSDGKQALVLGGEVVEGERHFGRGPDVDTKKLALLDLEKLEVVATRNLLTRARTIALDAHHAYIALADSDLVHALDRNTLADKRKFFTSGKVTRLLPVADRLLWVVASGPGATVLTTPELTPAEPSLVGAGIHLVGRGQATSLPLRLGKGWYLDGVLYDDTLRKPSRLVRPPGLTLQGNSIALRTSLNTETAEKPPHGLYSGFLDGTTRTLLIGGGEGPAIVNRYNMYPSADVGDGSTPDWLQPWAITVHGSELHYGKRVLRQREERSREGRLEQTEMLLDQPAAVQLSVEADGTARLAYLELTTGRPGEEQKLREGKEDSVASPLQLEIRGSILVALVGEEVYRLDVPKLNAGTFPPTFHFAPTAPAPVTGKTVVLELARIVGGAGKMELALARELPGVVLDGEKRVITVDTEELGKWLAETVTLPRFDADTLRRLDLFALKLTGAKSKNLQIWVPLSVLARDPELQEVRTEVGFHLEIAQERFKKRGEPTEPALSPKEELDLRQRVIELEQALERLRREVEILRKGREIEK